MSNISFEQIRKQVQAVPVVTAQAAQSATHKVIEAAKIVGSATKVVGSALHGVLPATNNRVGALEENVAVTIAALKLEIDQLRNQVGMPSQPIETKEVNDMAGALMALWHTKKEPARVEVVAAPAQALPVPVQEVVVSAPIVVAPATPVAVETAPSAPVEVSQAPVLPTNPLENSIPVSQPNNWHLGAGAQV